MITPIQVFIYSSMFWGFVLLCYLTYMSCKLLIHQIALYWSDRK